MTSTHSVDTIEAWAARYVLSTSLEHKQRPGPAPAHFGGVVPPLPVAPGRPPELRVSLARPRAASQRAMVDPRNRAKLLHKFWHHELQAAELMCWAVLRFADAEEEFRRGLLGIVSDELRHMRSYQSHLERLGFGVGAFPVRDWFWERVPTCASKVSFVALMGMGFEAANLEHTARFAGWFEAVGDAAGAELQRQVGREEVAHVRFAVRWFRRWAGTDDFETFCQALPKPLTPLLLRGKPLDVAGRRRAEMSPEFIQALQAWRPEPHGRS